MVGSKYALCLNHNWYIYIVMMVCLCIIGIVVYKKRQKRRNNALQIEMESHQIDEQNTETV